MSSGPLSGRRCKPCEGNVSRLNPAEAAAYLSQLQGWELEHDGRKIRKRWEMKDFVSGIEFFRRVSDVAEQEGHHPDLHLTGYRHVEVELWTHAIGGLSENDFILAAKIDRLPATLRAAKKPS